MEAREFISNTICQMDTDLLEQVKKILIGEYFSFSIIRMENIGIDALSEKACDYFEKVELKNNRSFDKQIEFFMSEIDAIVSARIVRATQPKKGENLLPPVSRARKYYEKKSALKNNGQLTVRQLLDYTRILMCLYTASINNQDKPIEDFEYSASCLDVEKIIEHLKMEEIFVVIPPNKRKRFELKGKYAADTCNMVMIILALYAVLNENLGD